MKVGEIYETNHYGKLIVTEYENANKVHYRFVDTGYEGVTKAYHIRQGKVKDYYCPHVQDIGFMGDYIKEPVKNERMMAVWRDLLKRCYNKDFHKRCPTYKGAQVHKDWHNLSNFAPWYEENYVRSWQIDKDILLKGNKVYSPETCCFVPPHINSLFTKSNTLRGKYKIGVSMLSSGRFMSCVRIYDKTEYIGTFDTEQQAFSAYKIRKESYIKELANSYYKEGDLTKKVYEALINYQVEETD